MSFSAFVSVVLDKAIDKPLDYGVPENLLTKVKPGIRVTVPVRGKPRKATILACNKESKIPNVLPIFNVISDKTVLTDELLALADWMSRYYATSLDKAISCMLPSSVKKDMEEKRQLLIQPKLSIPKIRELLDEIRSKFPKQAEVLDVILKHPKGILLTELLEKSQVSQSAIQTLLKKEVLEKDELMIDRSILEEEEFFLSSPKILSDEQKRAYESIEETLTQGSFQTHLIAGITGSGKTEIYLYAIEKALALGKGVIILVPEIALTTQTIERLKSRLQQRIGVLHYRLSDGERVDAWNAMQNGLIKVAIGARSAIFAPIQNLGLIIVDEEHESSYKQLEDTPCYHARDLSVIRGKINNATVVLGSATPSIESYFNAKSGKYKLHALTKRAGNSERPNIEVVNMTLEYEKNKGFTLFSDKLLTKIKEKMANQEKIILFLNRRGYFACQVCTECKKPLQCSHCDMSLTYHRCENLLSCHLCGYTVNANITTCPSCKKETLKYKGPGTEQIERALHAIFPDIKTLRMDKDTTKHKGSHERLFKDFRSGKADLLIGTQMIAKGLHFPSVTLVGILNADSSLNIPDFRSNEIVYQLITQVAGRSGRGELKGDVIIQTQMQDHPILELAKEEDYEKFYNLEIEERKMFHYPPFQRLAKVIFSGKDPEKVEVFAKKFRDTLTHHLDKSFEIHPVVPCGYSKIKDKHRFQCLIKGINILKLSHVLKNLPLKKIPSVHVHIDIDPTSTYS